MRASEFITEGSSESVSLRDMVNMVDRHYPKYYAELSGSDISDKQFERAIVNAYKKIMQKQGVAEGSLVEFSEKPEDGPGSDDYEDLLFHLAYEIWDDDGQTDQAKRKLSLLGWKPEPGDDYTAIVLYKIGGNDHRQYKIDDFEEYGQQGVAEGSEMLSLDDKIKMYANHKSKTQHAENRGDYTTADKHKKQASRIYSNIVNLHFGDDGKDAQNAANEYIRKSQAVAENFADGRNPQDKGDSKRHGINTKASVSSLRKTAKQGGRKGQLAHWLANMKSGRAKAKKK